MDLTTRTVALATAAMLVVGAGTAQADTVTFNFLPGTSTSWIDPGTGVTVTASAWSASTQAPHGLTAANLSLFNGWGLGVVAATTSPSAIDNDNANGGGWNFILFAFSEPVRMLSALINPYPDPSDSDATYWLFDSVPTLTGSSLSDVEATLAGHAPFHTSVSPVSAAYTQLLQGSDEVHLALLYGARISQANDSFKIDGLTIETVREVAEPATLLLVGLGVVAAGRRRYRR